MMTITTITETFESQHSIRRRIEQKNKEIGTFTSVIPEAIAPHIEDVDLFNILLAQDDLEKNLDFCDGHVGIEELAYMAGLDCTSANLEEMALVTGFNSWVCGSIQKAVTAIDVERVRMVKALIGKWGFRKAVSSLTPFNKITNEVKQELAKQEEKALNSMTSNTKEAKEDAYLTAKAETIIKLGLDSPRKWEKLPVTEDQEKLFLHHYNLQMAYDDYKDEETERDRERGVLCEWEYDLPLWDIFHSVEISR